jgi:uncharacterized protein (TIGR03437 family)
MSTNLFRPAPALFSLLIFAGFATPSMAQDSASRIVGKTIWDGQLVDYVVVNGHMVVDGDVDIGPVEDAGATPESKPFSPRSLVLPWVHPTLWPAGIVPYIVDSDVPDQQRVTDAVAIWNTNTPVRFIPRTNETTYLHFRRNTVLGACFTTLARGGGEQFVDVLDSCDAATVAHEMGHVVGLHHEQQRADRDYYMQLLVPLIEKIRLSELNLLPGGGMDVGGYDYGSLMEYGRYFTLKYAKRATLETIPAGMVIGSATTLSPGDIDSIARTYGTTPAKTTIASNPPGLKVIVDGATIIAPQSFDWPVGSQHTVDVPMPQAGAASGARFIFGRWSDNQAQAHTITASKDITVYHVSMIQQFLLQTGVPPAGAGSVTVTPSSPDGYYANNTYVTLTATPASGFRFLAWTGLILQLFHGHSDNPATFPVTQSLNYTPSFTTAPFVTVVTDPPEQQLTVDGVTTLVPQNFAWTPGSTHTINAPVTVNNQWTTIRSSFDKWSDGGAASHTVTVPQTLPVTLTASYLQSYKITTQVSGSGKVTVTPASADGFYPAGTTVQVTAAPAAGFQFQNWSGDLSGSVATQNLVMSDEMVVTAQFTKPFALDATAILNAASYQSTPLSPGEIIVIFGLNIGPPALTGLQLDAAGNISSTLAGTRVLFDGNPSPIVYTSQNQIAVIVPYAVAGKQTTQVQVELNGQRTNAVAMAVGTTSPAFFTANASGQGPGAILNQDGKLNTPSNPAARGSVVVLFITGEGSTTPAGVDGKLATAPFPKPIAPVSVRFGGPSGIVVAGSDLLYAGAAPGETAGVMQVNVKIPANAPTGNVPLAVIIGDQVSADWVTIAIQ